MDGRSFNITSGAFKDTLLYIGIKMAGGASSYFEEYSSPCLMYIILNDIVYTLMYALVYTGLIILMYRVKRTVYSTKYKILFSTVYISQEGYCFSKKKKTVL